MPTPTWRLTQLAPIQRVAYDMARLREFAVRFPAPAAGRPGTPNPVPGGECRIDRLAGGGLVDSVHFALTEAEALSVAAAVQALAAGLLRGRQMLPPGGSATVEPED